MNNAMNTSQSVTTARTQSTLPVGLVALLTIQVLFAAISPFAPLAVAQAPVGAPAVMIVEPYEGAVVAASTLVVKGAVDRAGQQDPRLAAHANDPLVDASAPTPPAPLPTQPLGTSTGSSEADYYFHGASPVGNGDSFPLPMTTAAPADGNPKIVYPSSVDGNTRPNFAYDAAHWQTPTPIALDHQDLTATWWIAPGPTASIGSAVAPLTWEIILFRDGAPFLTVDPVDAGPATPGTRLSYTLPDVSMPAGRLGILIDPHESYTADTPILYDSTSYPSSLHVAGPAAPLTVDAGGPYSGTIGSATPIAATVSGGTAPISCAWIGTGATFANANACSTTVSFATTGLKTLTVTATDHSNPTPATATDTATVTISSTGTDYYFHGASPIGNGDTFPLPMTTAAPSDGTPRVVYPSSLDGSSRPNSIYDAAQWQTSSSITLNHQDLTATWWIHPGPKSGTESLLLPSTWEIVLLRDGVVFKTVAPAIAGPAVVMAGPTQLSYTLPDISMPASRLGILLDPHNSDTVDSPILYDAASYPSRLHVSAPTVPDPLTVDAGGPYTGNVGAPIAIAATVTGGTSPVSCVWTGADATFADAGSCSTTVGYSGKGSKTLMVTATDSSPTPATATGTAMVTVAGSSPERIEFYVDGAANGNPTPISTSDTTAALWSGALDLTGLSGLHTITAKWFDAGVDSNEAPLATAIVHVTVQETTGTATVAISAPSSDGQLLDLPATFNGTYTTDGHPPATPVSSQAFDPGLAQLLQNPALGTATLSLQDLPGFVAAIPIPTAATPTLMVGLTGAVPPDAPALLAGWRLQYTPNVKLSSLVGHTQQAARALSIDEALAQINATQSAPSGPYLPGPSAADGIGPGSAIFLPTGDGSGGLCSASFLLQDPSTLKHYLATAGHCLLKSEAGPATTGYETPSAVWPEIDICFKDCIENWNGLVGKIGSYVAFTASPDNSYHPVAFAQAQGVGLDIGLIEIPASAEPLLRPYLPEWGGPAEYQEPDQGELLVHYGHGAYCCPVRGAIATRLPVDQGRIAVSLGNDGSSFQALGDLSGGDSGSASATLKPRLDKLLLGDGAVGINTHGTLMDHIPLFAGTLLRQGIRMAAAKGYGNLELVNEDGTLVSLGDTSPTPKPHAIFTSPGSGASVAQGTSVTIEGTATFPPPNPWMTYYLHRDGCGTVNDNPHMDTTPRDTAEAGDGCGETLGAVGLLHEALSPMTLPVLGAFGGGVFVDYPATPNPDHDILLNASKPIEAQIYFTGYAGEPRQAYHDLEGRLYTGSGANQVLVGLGRIAQILPPTGQVNFTMTITGPSLLSANTALTFQLFEHESLTPMFVDYGGTRLSQIRLPLANPPANAIEVSVDDPTFAEANQLTVNGTTSWSTTWNVEPATPTGSHTLYARAAQGTLVQGPLATLELSVTAVEAPHAEFTWNAQQLAVQFNDTSTPGTAPITSWTWGFGDGATSTARNPFHSYASDGSYIVSLTVSDGKGNQATTGHAVTVTHAALWNVQVRILDLQGKEKVGWTTVVANAHTGDAGPWSYTWSPTAMPASGNYTLEARLLKDGVPVASDDRTFVVPNHGPRLTAPGSQQTAEGEHLAFSISASDPDTSDTVTLSASGLPAGATFDAGAFDWTPSYDQAGNYTMTFTADDGHGGVATQNVALTVANTNRAPALDAIANVTAQARTTIHFTVHAADPDGDAVTYSTTGLPQGATLDASTGAFAWTPTKAQVGSYTLSFSASDGRLGTAQTMHIVVTRK